MEGVPRAEKIPSLSQTYDREMVERVAVSEVMHDVEVRLRKIGEPSIENSLKVLTQLLAEYGAVRPGTTIPLDNGNRHRFEAASKMLSQVEIEEEFTEVMRRTKLPANDNVPETFVAANDNVQHAIAANDNMPHAIAA